MRNSLLVSNFVSAPEYRNALNATPIGSLRSRRSLSRSWTAPGSSSTPARAESARRASPPLRRGAAPPPGCAPSSSRPTRPTASRTRSTPLGADPTPVDDACGARRFRRSGRWRCTGRGAELAGPGDRRPRRRWTLPPRSSRCRPGWTSSSACFRSSVTTVAARLRRVIVDCAPTGETLRLLSFPEIARWWLEKVLPVGAAAGHGGAADRAHDPRRRRSRARTCSPTSSASSAT